MEKQLVIITTESQLEETFSKVAEKIFAKKEPPKDLTERLTRREAAMFIGCSYQSMYNYVKQNLIKEHGSPGKKFFLRSELITFIQNSDNK
jgi:hypothetical protein